jgi:lipopolysaccharide transport system permease protein
LFESQAVLLKNTSLHPIFYTLEEWAFQVQTFAQSFLLVALVLAFLKPLILFNFIVFGLFPLFNFLLALYWIPVLICLLGAQFRDLYQLVPILLQLLFLLSPILYRAESLGRFAFTADLNFPYLLISLFRDALLAGHVHPLRLGLLLSINFVGTWSALALLNRQRRVLPFLV